jgi:hypothetical protein
MLTPCTEETSLKKEEAPTMPPQHMVASPFSKEEEGGEGFRASRCTTAKPLTLSSPLLQKGRGETSQAAALLVFNRGGALYPRRCVAVCPGKATPNERLDTARRLQLAPLCLIRKGKPQSRRRRPCSRIADCFGNLLDCVHDKLWFLDLNVVRSFGGGFVLGVWCKCGERILRCVPRFVQCSWKIGGQWLPWAEIERLALRQNKQRHGTDRFRGGSFFDLIQTSFTSSVSMS